MTIPAPSSVDWKTEITDPAYDEFQPSARFEHAVKLIEDNDLLKVSRTSLSSVADALKRFEFTEISRKLASDSNITAGMASTIAQTVYNTGMRQSTDNAIPLDNMSHIDLEREQQVNKEIESIMKVIYDDPLANPMHDKAGGFLDVQQASRDLAEGKDADGMTEGMMQRNQKIVIDAIALLPVDVQQLAAQGARLAAIEGQQYGGFEKVKIPLTISTKTLIERKLSEFDMFNERSGKSVANGGLKKAFEHAMYDAKGTQVFAEQAGNTDVASKKPLPLITVPINDPYLKMLGDGINKEIISAHAASQFPHTFKGDSEIDDRLISVSCNVDNLNNGIYDNLKDPERDKSYDKSLLEAYNQSNKVHDHAMALSEETLKDSRGIGMTAEHHKIQIEERSLMAAKLESVIHNPAPSAPSRQPEPTFDSPRVDSSPSFMPR